MSSNSQVKNLKLSIDEFSPQTSPSSSFFTNKLVQRSTIINNQTLRDHIYSKCIDNYSSIDPRKGNIGRCEPFKLSKKKIVQSEDPEVRDYFIEYLPDIVLGEIMSYLHWKEKEWLLAAFPSIKHKVDNSLAWTHFDNDRLYAVNKLMMFIYLSNMVEHEIDVIETYGRWFKSCTIYLSNIARSTYDEMGRNDIKLLSAISKHCKNLRSLHIKHGYGIDSSHVNCEDYLDPIQVILDRRQGDVSLYLSRLFYKSTETVESGIQAFLVSLQHRNMLTSIVSLDCSHGLLFNGDSHVLGELTLCDKLKVLKCPLGCLDTNVVKTLYLNRLESMYLVNDEHTYEMEIYENQSIDWNSIYTSVTAKGLKPYSLKVHYIFRNRVVDIESNHLAPNPFVASLVFDNLTTSISSSFLRSISDLYGNTVENIALCSNFWEFLMQLSDLHNIDETFTYLASKCIRLKSFLSCLHMPSSALQALAETSRTLKTLRVFKEKTQLSHKHISEATFMELISNAIGSPLWSMLSRGSHIFEIPEIDNNLLFGTCVNEI